MARKPATQALRPPTLDEDAAERKRVLNVMAQRRYRTHSALPIPAYSRINLTNSIGKRKKERIQALESRAKDSAITSPLQGPEIGGDRMNSTPATTTFELQDKLPNTEFLSNLSTAPHRTENQNDLFNQSIFDPSIFSNTDLPQCQADQDDSDTWEFLKLPENDSIWPYLDASSFDTGTNPIQDSTELNKQLSHDGCDISEELQAYDTTFFTFPDDKTLQVPSLTLLNAAMRVAQQLQVSDIIWDITAVSPFYQGSSPNTSSTSVSPPSLESGLSTTEQSPASSHFYIDLSELPSHLKPTRSQRLIPHHPLLDLLPWPSTRDKLIQVFHLPVHMRPGNAQDPMGLVRFVYDMEDDSGEGVTIAGQNPFEPGTWEIGQLVFERWWWAFDTGVVEDSNRSRRRRGKEILTIKI
ncbi:hypothetical protein N7450_007104 [Penicillium hetheringtonii]|uniref:Uncharacterized protein n=1 Tax=Penicillium hetheringtonii TaxID=911720 RepID=A0AAD6DGT0_9EURO|nr:hypothetical protein N7450_007104 [Penicillium hetheringtonii]